MFADLHMHMILDGVYYRDAIGAHRQQPVDALIRARLAAYRDVGICYLRDGGDRWDVCVRARELAAEYGITYRIPVFPIHKAGHYGAFIGRSWQTIEDYRTLVAEAKRRGADFIKIMISGLMDFSQPEKLTDAPLTAEEIRLLTAIAHDADFAVMAHCNGAQTTLAAVEAGVDSVEHGAYLTDEACHALAESDTVWIPTLSTIGNLLGSGRYPDAALREILSSAQENVRRVAAYGGLVGLGSDAGAYRVEHPLGAASEYRWLHQALGDATEALLQRAQAAIMKKF